MSISFPFSTVQLQMLYISPFESRGPQPPKTSRPSGTRRPGSSGTNARDHMAARMHRSMPAKPEVFPELCLSCEQVA